MLISVIFEDHKGKKRREEVSYDLFKTWQKAGLIKKILFMIEAYWQR